MPQRATTSALAGLHVVPSTPDDRDRRTMLHDEPHRAVERRPSTSVALQRCVREQDDARSFSSDRWDAGTPYSWRPMLPKQWAAAIGDSRIEYDALIHRVTWKGRPKPNPVLLARGLTSRAIEGASVAHAAEEGEHEEDRSAVEATLPVGSALAPNTMPIIRHQVLRTNDADESLDDPDLEATGPRRAGPSLTKESAQSVEFATHDVPISNHEQLPIATLVAASSGDRDTSEHTTMCEQSSSASSEEEGPPSTLSGTAPLRRSRDDDDTESSQQSHLKSATPGSAFPSFESSARSAQLHRAAGSSYEVDKVVASDGGQLSNVLYGGTSCSSSGHWYNPQQDSSGDITNVLNPSTLPPHPPFCNTTDVVLAEHRRRMAFHHNYELSWLRDVIEPWEQTVYPSGGGVVEPAGRVGQERGLVDMHASERVAFRCRMCPALVEEIAAREALHRSLIEVDGEPEEWSSLMRRFCQSKRVLRGLSPLRRALTMYAHRRRQRKAVAALRRARCLQEETSQRVHMEAEASTERCEQLAASVYLEEAFFRTEVYKLYASLLAATLYGWVWQHQRCALYPVCFGTQLSAALRVSGRVCDCSLFHLLSKEEESRRADLERDWCAFHVSMRAHVDGLNLVHREEVSTRAVHLHDETHERWMLSITRFKVIATYLRRDVEFNEMDARWLVQRDEQSAIESLLRGFAQGAA